MKKEQVKSTTNSELVSCIKLLLCSIEGICSGIKSDPEYLSAYIDAQQVVARHEKLE